MDLLLVSATPFEIQPTLDFLEREFVRHRPFQFQKGELTVHVLITGVGMVPTAYALGRVLSGRSYDLAVNAGIAGSFRRDWPLGQVVQVISERLGDLGVETAEGGFRSVFDLDLLDGAAEPFTEGVLQNKSGAAFDFLPKAQGLTVNKVHGARASIEQVRTRYPEVEVESMEGGAFFYACLLENISFLEIRSLSNYVEPRNRDNWEVGKAIGNLNATLREVLRSLQQ